MKKSICTRSALAALLLAAAASLAACNDQEQKNVAADTSKPAPATIMTTEDPDTFVDPSDDLTVPADELYTGFINGFKTAVNEPKDAWYYGPAIDPANVPGDAVGITVTGIWGDSFSYVLYDMDKDGTDELFIGEKVKDQDETRINVFGVVTYVNGKYKILAAGWERSELTYLGGTSFYETGSSGASFHGASLYNYNGSKKSMDIICTIEYETKDDGTTEIEFFDGEDGKIRSNVASYKDKEAEEKFDQAKKDASKEKNELLDKEWTKVSFR